MPNKVVAVKRWHLLAILAALVITFAAGVTVNDRRIDSASVKINQNAERIAASNVKRVELVAGFRAADRRLCRKLNDSFARIRASVKFNEARFDLFLLSTGIDPESPQGHALVKQAQLSASETTARFHPTDCTKLPPK